MAVVGRVLGRVEMPRAAVATGHPPVRTVREAMVADRAAAQGLPGLAARPVPVAPTATVALAVNRGAASVSAVPAKTLPSWVFTTKRA